MAMRLLKRNGWAAVLVLPAVLSWALSGCTPQAQNGLNVAEIINAAGEGDAEAQYQLGLLYAKGEGVPQNEVNAYTWSCLAAAQGEELAARNRDSIANRLSPEQHSKAQAQVTELQADIAQHRKRPPSLHLLPSSSRPPTVANKAALRSWLQNIKPAAGGN